MSEQEFLKELANILQLDKAPGPDTDLAALPEWDSLAWMMLLAFAERERLRPVKLSQLRRPGTARELYQLFMDQE